MMKPGESVEAGPETVMRRAWDHPATTYIRHINTAAKWGGAPKTC